MTALHPPLPNLGDSDLRLLRVFHAVVSHRGFAAAQRQLGISASNISVHIAQLERRFGFRLCERGRKGFRLTDEGRAVYTAAVELFRATDQFRHAVGGARGRLVGELHFGFVDAVATNRALQLEKSIAAFNRAAPDVKLHLDVSSPQELLQGLIEERYHAILSPQLERREFITYLPVAEERKFLYCGRAHPFFKRPDAELSLDDLARAPAVTRSYMNEWLVRDTLELSRNASVSHMESVALMILSGRYLGHLPDHFAAQWTTGGQMRPLLADRVSYTDWFHLAHRTREHNRAALLLIEHLAVAKPPAAPPKRARVGTR